MYFRSFFIVSLISFICFVHPAHAIILYGADDSANTRNPDNGVPWDNVVSVYGGNSLAGTAVYLGSGYFLTANHLGFSSTNGKISFDGETMYSIDSSFAPKQVSSGISSAIDLKIFRVSDPVVDNLKPVNLSKEPLKRGTEITIIGAGYGRRDSPMSFSEIDIDFGNEMMGFSNDMALGAQAVAAVDVIKWGGPETAEMRWGTNQISLVYPSWADKYGYTYKAYLITAENGRGEDEASLAYYDSGGPFFYMIDDEWYLGGIATIVNNMTPGSTTFGTDSIVNSDYSVYVNLSAYHDDILRITGPLLATGPNVPEPAEYTFVLALVGLGFAINKRRG